MPDPAPVINPDEQPIFDALVDAGVEPKLAYTAIRSIRQLAAANIIARFESKLDSQNAKLDAISSAQNAKLDAISIAQNCKLDAISSAQNAKLDAISIAQNCKLDAQDSKLRMLMWMIGAAVGLIGILIRLWG